MPEVENKPKNWVKNRSPQGPFEGQNTFPLNMNNSLALALTFFVSLWIEEQHSIGYPTQMTAGQSLKEQYPDLRNDLVETHFLLNFWVCFLLPALRIIWFTCKII